MKYELLKIVLRVAKWIAEWQCPTAANHLIQDALGDIKAL